ncbi:FG-GAP repeat protein [Streptomyces mirabilis]|uniref:FG-GAP repeat protein n=1 Tax=Streptomyces mirabilis TaxID=68239 RepID=UPI00371CC6E9
MASAHEKFGNDTDAGGLAVLWGSPSGLTGKGVAIADPAGSSHDYWGKTLAAGDFDGDGKADLLVGSYENGGDGTVTYLPSSGTKITTTGSRAIWPADAGVSTTGTPAFGADFAD